MTIRLIAVHVDDTPEALDRIALAADLARRHAATLLGLSALKPPPPLVVEGTVVDPWPGESGYRRVRDTLIGRQAQFRANASNAPAIEWSADVEDANRHLVSATIGADLIVVGRNRVSGDFFCLDPEAVVTLVGRPVLFVPKGLRQLPAGHALIAWKDRREARRAIADALPVLRTMARVSLVAAAAATEAEEQERSLSEAARYLNRHGIDCLIRAVGSEEGAETAAMSAEIERIGPDLVVAGAFGHSRLGEWIFGGMTRHLLDKVGVCCLLSH